VPLSSEAKRSPQAGDHPLHDHPHDDWMSCNKKAGELPRLLHITNFES
jgi:hypothetical protein